MTMGKQTLEEVFYKLTWYLKPIKTAPNGGRGTNLDNQYLPPGQWFSTALRQSGEKVFVFFADRDYLAKTKSKSPLLRDLVIEYSNGDASCEIRLPEEWHVKAADNLVQSLAEWVSRPNVEVVYN